MCSCLESLFREWICPKRAWHQAGKGVSPVFHLWRYAALLGRPWESSRISRKGNNEMESRHNWGSPDFHPGPTRTEGMLLALCWSVDLSGRVCISLGLGVKTQQHEGGQDSPHIGDETKHTNLSHGPGEFSQLNSLQWLTSEVFGTCVCKRADVSADCLISYL